MSPRRCTAEVPVESAAHLARDALNGQLPLMQNPEAVGGILHITQLKPSWHLYRR